MSSEVTIDEPAIVHGRKKQSPKSASYRSIPVLVTFYNRPESLATLISALGKIRPEVVFFASDGPASEAARKSVEACRVEVEKISWKCEVIKLYSDSNLGMFERFRTAVEEVFSRFTGLLVLEDDCIPDPAILSYLNLALNMLGEDDRVATFSCFNPLGQTPGIADAMTLSKVFRSGGFYLKKDHWKRYIETPRQSSWSVKQALLEAMKYPGLLNKLLKLKVLLAHRRSIHVGDISMQSYFFRSNYLSALPTRSLISNIGFGDSATHTKYLPNYPISRKPMLSWTQSRKPILTNRIEVLEGWFYLMQIPGWLGYKLKNQALKKKMKWRI